MTRSEANRKSWTDPAVRKARLTRIAGEVNGLRYDSLSMALKALELPGTHLMQMRKELKHTGSLTLNGIVFRALTP